MSPETILSAASVLVAVIALGISTLLLARQNKQLEHERNAGAVLAAAAQLAEPAIVQAFDDLEGIERRYPSDEEVRRSFDDSSDDRALTIVAQYVETVAALARRGVLDPSLLAESVGFLLIARWITIHRFVERLRRVRGNPRVLENFEWLAKYVVWWRDQPPPAEPNYAPDQFAPFEYDAGYASTASEPQPK